MTPGLKFSTSTSADSTRRRRTSLPSGFFRFSVTDRLPAFWARNEAPMCLPLRSASAPSWRARSPPSGTSILTTSAPSNASWYAQNGPASTLVRSRTRMPASALLMGSSFPCGASSAPHERIGHLEIGRDPDALGVQVLLDRLGSRLAADAGFLVAAEGRREARRAVIVDPHGARLELLDHRHRAAQVARPHRR